MGRLQTARLEGFIRRWGSIKGGGSVLSETLGDVFPILDLERLTPENHLPAGWSLAHRFTTVLGVAAQLSGVSIINPVGSGQIAVVDQVIIQSELTQNLTYGVNLPLFVGATTFENLDTRQANNLNGNLVMGANANVGSSELGGFLRVVANESFFLTTPSGLAVLGPGGQFSIVSATVNSNLTASFHARVRLAEPSELSF